MLNDSAPFPKYPNATGHTDDSWCLCGCWCGGGAAVTLIYKANHRSELSLVRVGLPPHRSVNCKAPKPRQVKLGGEDRPSDVLVYLMKPHLYYDRLYAKQFGDVTVSHIIMWLETC
ncbi:hypothetical protein Nepgr_016568 [Nepenthes gracilis]|uniref:Uncharacterized protein n=1 Tax=Nepenthes gracilis TaxID=150966 RepID=A0AAD3XRF4_NEPGR|nr:hypothetical protein Nepgr_016568 [Nepenthes gracilis]